MVKDICINSILCKVLFEEEVCFPDHELRRLFSKWNDACTKVDTKASSEDGGGEGVLLDSVSSDFGEGDEIGTGEEATIQCQVASSVLGVARQTLELNFVVDDDQLEDMAW